MPGTSTVQMECLLLLFQMMDPCCARACVAVHVCGDAMRLPLTSRLRSPLT